MSQFAAAAWMILLAAWLLTTSPRSRAARLFGTFLFLQAVQITAVRLAGPDITSGLGAVWFAFSRYALLAQAPLLAYFAIVYHRAGRPRPAAWIPLAVVALAAETAYLVDHCLDVCVAEARYGPLIPLTTGTPLVQGIVAVVLAWTIGRRPGDPRRAAAALLAMALALNATLDGAIAAWTLVETTPRGFLAAFDEPLWPAIGITLQATAAPAGIVALAGVTAGRGGITPWAPPLLGIGAVATGAYIVYGPQASAWGIGLAGVWRLMLPALATYALVRHRLFDADRRIRWTLSHGSLVALILAAYWLVSESAEAIISARLGTAAGLTVAAALVLAVRPLERWTRKAVDAVLPPAERARSKDKRLDLYRAQVRLIWADGRVTRKEQAILNHLRELLELNPVDAAEAESKERHTLDASPDA